jgi:hypothetical protein
VQQKKQPKRKCLNHFGVLLPDSIQLRKPSMRGTYLMIIVSLYRALAEWATIG